MLVVVAYEFPQLLLSALQCCVKLLHLVHDVGLLHFQTLAIRFHRCNNTHTHKALGHTLTQVIVVAADGHEVTLFFLFVFFLVVHEALRLSSWKVQMNRGDVIISITETLIH